MRHEGQAATRVGRALRDHRSAEEVAPNTPANVPMRGVEPRRAAGPRRSLDRRRPHASSSAPTRSSSAAAPAGQFAGLTVGNDDSTPGRTRWQVVGIFEADGGVAETEIWCDARVLQGAYRRGNTYPDGAGAPRLERQLRHVPRLADVEPAGQRAGAARDRILRAAVARAELADPGRSASASPR